MDKSSYEFDIRVRFAETDVYGLVHHSNFFIWFEMGRIEFLRNIGLTLRDFENEGVFLPIRDASCRAHFPIKNDEMLVIKTYFKEITAVRIVFDYEIRIKETEKIAVTGTTTNAFVDGNGKIKKIPETLLQRIKASAVIED